MQACLLGSDAASEVHFPALPTLSADAPAVAMKSQKQQIFELRDNTPFHVLYYVLLKDNTAEVLVPILETLKKKKKKFYFKI